MTAPTTSAVLEVEDLNLRFGGLKVLNDVSLRVNRGQVHGLLGPNGAGKTSLFNCVSGLYRSNSGVVRLLGEDVTSLPPHRLAERGIARTFQHPMLDPRMSVLDNVLVGAHPRLRGDLLSSLAHLPGPRHDERAVLDSARALLDRMGLDDIRAQTPGMLPYGDLKRVELARAILAQPTILMLDEPAGGLSHQEVDDLVVLIGELVGELDLTVLLVEHHMSFVARITDVVDILVEGRNVVTGTATEVRRNPAVIDAYLGQAI